ncbi:hypothetical protein NDU88_008476 [Pleurodeles waltl]|uniref:Uncharacterized protein n=1 Tax=Pleurodeles waltl TaxID=8319 RepID=A0AAV7RVU3_PLEWA|nr:hypothetical protein NDU88_008476 [Pleurodeles waltl]
MPRGRTTQAPFPPTPVTTSRPHQGLSPPGDPRVYAVPPRGESSRGGAYTSTRRPCHHPPGSRPRATDRVHHLSVSVPPRLSRVPRQVTASPTSSRQAGQGSFNLQGNPGLPTARLLLHAAGAQSPPECQLPESALPPPPGPSVCHTSGPPATTCRIHTEQVRFSCLRSAL